MTNDDRLPLAQRLDILTRKALDQLGEILNAPNPEDGPNHIALNRVQVDAAKTILRAQIRADEAKFRNRQTDEVQQILEAVPPWQNAYAERLIGSIRREILDHVVVLGERHLRHILLSYMTYHNEAARTCR